MEISIRVDSSTIMGNGHIMRCLTLAEGLRNIGCNVTFLSRNQVGNMNRFLISKGFKVMELPRPKTSTFNNNSNEYKSWLGVTEAKDADDTISFIAKNKPFWLIIDHYSLGEEWEKKLRPYVKNIMVIDDLANRKHDCDIILDQNWFENLSNRYDKLVPHQCIKFLGPKYALLRSEFFNERRNINTHKKVIKRIFVFFGSSDPQNFTEVVLKALSQEGLLHLYVDVVIGANNKNKNSLGLLVNNRPNTTLHIQVDNIASIMGRADLAIGSGGVNTWERMVLGLPSIVLITAENQRRFTEDLAKNNYISYLGDKSKISIEMIKKNIISAISDLKKLSFQRKFGLELINNNSLDNVINKLKSIKFEK